jgi:uncharacterized RDD family membrane protein YckC
VSDAVESDEDEGEGVPASWGGASGPRAGFWQRFGGAFVDGALVAIVGTLLQLAFRSALGELLSIALSAGYFTYFEGGPQGAGFGKQLVGIRVIDAHTGRPIGHRRAFIRWITALISALCLLVGYLWMLRDPERQCWHDKFAGDVVVPTVDYPVRDPSGARYH